MTERSFRTLREKDVLCFRDVAIATRSSGRVGGDADLYLCPQNTRGLLAALDFAGATGMSYRTVGRMSNLLFSDSGFRGILIDTTKINGCTFGEARVTCGCGASFAAICRAAARRSLGGLAPLSGIPGTVGGAVHGNAGAFGLETADALCAARVYDPKTGKIRTLLPSELEFSYRDSLLRQEPLVVLSAEFALSPMKKAEAEEALSDVRRRRLLSQPHGEPSFGSFFRRPRPDLSAGALIDACGLKGLTVGGAAVSEKHAGFLVNRAAATAADFLALAELVRERVALRFGVTLIPEVEIVA